MNYRAFLAAPLFALVIAASGGCNTTVSKDTTVTAENPLTGEQKSYANESDVPSGWIVCNGNCPPPASCGTLDEASCLVRKDCAPLYSAPNVFSSCVESAPTCDPASCGPQPGVASILCDDGSIGGFTGRCIAEPNAGCGWEIRSCPEMQCQDSDCKGPRPGAPNFQCEDGSVGGPVCEGTPNGCGWVIRQCPDVKCTQAECGPNPYGLPNQQCSDGSVGGPVCERDNGACGWTIRACP